MIKQEIEKLKIDIEDAMMSGDYESVVKVLKFLMLVPKLYKEQ